jgi:hypothetical protein
VGNPALPARQRIDQRQGDGARRSFRWRGEHVRLARRPACGRTLRRTTTRPRAAIMTSRRAAASAGRNRASRAVWIWRGRVPLPLAAAAPSPARKTGNPAMATSVARMRFSASRCFSIAKSQSNAVSLLAGGRIIGEAGGVWIKRAGDGGQFSGEALPRRHPRARKARRFSPSFAILGLDPRIHAGASRNCGVSQNRGTLRLLPRPAARLRHGSRGLRDGLRPAPP